MTRIPGRDVTRIPGRDAAALAGAVVRRPDLWAVALRFVPPRWWLRRPPSPLPPAGYRQFRMETMYGAGGALGGEDLIAYLEWCRRLGPRKR